MKSSQQVIDELQALCNWYERAIARSKQRVADSQAFLAKHGIPRELEAK